MIRHTTTALLDDLARGDNQAAWEEVDARLRPIIFGFARQLGIEQDGAADVAQETLARFVTAYREGKYDRTKGRLQAWTLGIARNCIREHWDSVTRRREARGESAMVTLPREDEMAALWEAQWQRTIIERGLERLREETRSDERTVRIVEMLALERRSAEDVAGELGVTTNDVYVAKHRALKRLRAIMEDLRALYEME